MINRERLIKTFIELASINSPSGEEKDFALFLFQKLTDLGGDVELDTYGNLIAKFNGHKSPLMLNAHLDTVEPGRQIKPKIQGNKIKSSGKTILGGDAKAGISIIIEAVTAARENKIPTRSLELVFTREEESSLGGSKNLDYSKIKAKEGIVFDGDEKVSSLFISSPTYYNLDVNIIGKSAHAGVEPEKGISAIEIAAKIIALLPLGRIDSETTMNIGTIQGGSARNAVPENVKFSGELRSRNKIKLKKILTDINLLFLSYQKKYPKSQINYIFEKEFEGFLLKPENILIKKVSKILNGLGLVPELKDSGGGSDANIFYNKGINVLIVGTGVYESHTTREYAMIDQMTDTAKFCLEYIKD